MRPGITIEVTAAARARLEAIVADRNSPQEHIWRARIILLTSASVGMDEIERQAGVDKNSVWRWQERFMNEGVDGLLRDKTRRLRIAPLSPEVASAVVARTLETRLAKDPLDGSDDGQGDQHQRLVGSAHLAKTRSSAASDPTVQGVQ
jgi:hypothetical protein